jgi:long-chain acyl-CoA synthetase
MRRNKGGASFMVNAVDPLFQHAASTPDHPAVRGAGTDWTYWLLRERLTSVAAMLRESGVQPGDRVQLVAQAVPEFAAAYYGIQAAGAIAVTVNTMASKAELEYIGHAPRYA